MELGEDPADDRGRGGDLRAQHIHDGSVAGQEVGDGLFDRTDHGCAGRCVGCGDTEGGVDVGERVGCIPTQGAAHGQRDRQRFTLA